MNNQPNAPPTPMSLGTSLRILRDMKGWKQLDLAKRVGISRNYLCAIEKDRVMAKSTTIARIVHELCGEHLDLTGDAQKMLNKAREGISNALRGGGGN